jgi:hypothetical protein
MRSTLKKRRDGLAVKECKRQLGSMDDGLDVERTVGKRSGTGRDEAVSLYG